MAEIIESLRQDHRAIEKLLLVLEHELGIFARGERPDYKVIQTAIDYFRNYPDSCHHPKEDVVFDALKARGPATAVRVGDLPAEHRDCADRLDRAARAVESVLADGEILRQTVDDLVRDFIEHERRHMAMEEQVFFPPRSRYCGRRTGPGSPPPSPQGRPRRPAGSSRRDSTRCASASCAWRRRPRRSVAERCARMMSN